MNIGSVPVALVTSVAVSGNPAQTTGGSTGTFGSVLAGMTQTIDSAKTQISSTQLSTISGTISDILSATSAEDLSKLLEAFTGVPQQDILSGLGKLDESSLIDEWAKVLGFDPAELMETISTLLEEAGVSEEELTEVFYSNDLWELLSVIQEQAPKLSIALEEMMNSKSQSAQQQAAEVLAFLKTFKTVMPTKDLLGWQQTGLAELKGFLDSLSSLKSSDSQSKAPVHSTFISALVNVTKRSQEQTPNDGKSEQNQTQNLQNTAVQPIVSRNVFTLETQETRTASQSEALLAKLQGLFKQTNFGQQGGTNRLLVKLNPEQLGQIRIELIQINGVMTARILASTALGKEMLDSQLHQLRQSFNQQNIQVDRIDVTQAVQDPSRNDRSQNFNHQQFKGNDDQQETLEPENDEQQSFQEYLLDVEV